MSEAGCVARHAPGVTCKECSLSAVCLPIAVNKNELQSLDDIIRRSRPLRRGEGLFRAGEEFQSVYAVRSGAFKTCTLTVDGEEQVTGFYLPGEILGMDGLGTNAHTNTARALESSSICEIPFDRLESLSAQIPTLQRHFFNLMSREIQADQQLMLLLTKKPADARLAAFLLNLGTRYQRRGLSARRLRLPMSRNDIGNYLGLAVETVSRIFTRLQGAGVLGVAGKEIEILDGATLTGIASATTANDVKLRSA
jgi:CRP/FNR family transcriptional regulator